MVLTFYLFQTAAAASSSSQSDDLFLDDDGSGGFYPEDDDDFSSASGSGKHTFPPLPVQFLGIFWKEFIQNVSTASAAPLSTMFRRFRPFSIWVDPTGSSLDSALPSSPDWLVVLLQGSPFSTEERCRTDGGHGVLVFFSKAFLSRSVSLDFRLSCWFQTSSFPES